MLASNARVNNWDEQGQRSPLQAARLHLTPCKKVIRILKLFMIFGSAVNAITRISVLDLVLKRASICETVNFHHPHCILCSPGSSVGIATGYGLDGPVIKSRWGARFPAPVQTGTGAHPAPCKMGTESFPGVKSGRSVKLTPHPL